MAGVGAGLAIQCGPLHFPALRDLGRLDLPEVVLGLDVKTSKLCAAKKGRGTNGPPENDLPKPMTEMATPPLFRKKGACIIWRGHLGEPLRVAI